LNQLTINNIPEDEDEKNTKKKGDKSKAGEKTKK